MSDNGDGNDQLDDAIFDDRLEHYKGLAAGFSKSFIANTNRQSILAHTVCQKVEDGRVSHEDLSDNFPKRKRNHKRRVSEAKKARYPIEKEKKRLQKQIEVLEETREGIKRGSTQSGETAEIKSKLDGLYREVSGLDRQLTEIKVPRSYPKHYKKDDKRDKGKIVTGDDWRYLQDWFGRQETRYLQYPTNPLYDHVLELCDYLKLDEAHRQLAVLLLCYQQVSEFKSFIDTFSMKKQKGYNAIVGKMIGVDPVKVSAMMREDSPLVANGLIVLPEKDDGLPVISDGLIDVLSEQNITFDEIVKRLIGEPVSTDLDWDEDFSHLGVPGDELIKILQGAREVDEPGINMLLYGIQDAGKTEAVKAACKKAGLTLYAVGEKKGVKGEPTRADRISQALLAQSLLADQPNAAVLFDEMEDALPRSGITDDNDKNPTGSASKIYLNRMLEKNRTITFWTANDVDKFHPAVRRRMRFSVQFRIPPSNVREKMWKSISAKHDFTLAAEDCRRLGREFMAPPGMITTAVKNAKLTQGGIPSIEASLRASATVVFGSRKAIEVRDRLPDRYDLKLLNATVEDEDFDIDGLTDDLAHAEHRDISMLLYGPPGTGKSAYVRHLANALGMEVLFMRASDLLSPYHGETEQKIAAAFAMAEETKQFLIIDEADSMLHDRGKVEYSWQVPMINEMLTWLESHPLPVAFTTNMTDNLDPASKRRFVFKIKCDYMTPAQADYGFRLFFDQEPPRGLAGLDMLTPGDFATVMRQMKFRREPAQPQDIVAMLAHEIKLKNKSRKRPIGFMAEFPSERRIDVEHREPREP